MNTQTQDAILVVDRRSRLRDYREGRCSACGDFGPIDLNIQRCEDCAALLRQS